MKQVAAILFFLIVTLSSSAQGFKLDGVVIDAEDHTSMPGAYVKLSYQMDSTRGTEVLTDTSGRFSFLNLAADAYVLEIKYLGYKTTKLRARINAADKHMGNILLVKNPTTFKDVQIVAKEDRVKQKDDTSEYNAAAFKVNPDASAEDLITKMPGITSNNGTVTAHGETVQQVYVDGKEFFGQDATLAIKNLPAEVIDKVQVFDKWSDQAQFTGFDDGNSQKAINIVTKKNRRNGVFGKLYAGFGYLTNNTYSVGGSLNWFNGDRRLSVIGMSNNVNIQNFSTQDILGVIGTATQRQGQGFGGGRGGGGGGGNNNAASNFLVGQTPGISTTSSAGLNYVDSWGKKKKVKVVGSYFFNLTNNANTTSLTRQYFNAGDSSDYYMENDQTKSRNINHRVNLRIEYAIDTMNKLVFTPKLNLQQNSQTLNQFGQTTVEQVIPVSQSQTTYSPYNFGYNLSGDILWQHKFQKKRRTFSVDISSTYNYKASHSTLNSLNYYSENRDSVWLNQTSPSLSNSYTLGANFAYTEPVGKTGIMQFNYTPSNQWSNSNQSTNNYDSLTEGYNLPDTALSNKYTDIYMTQKGGITYRNSIKKGGKSFNFSVGLNGQYALLTGTEVFPDAYNTNRNFYNVLPNAMFMFKTDSGTSLRVFYRTSTNPPSISQLQNVINNSNPLLLSTGNPLLKQSFTHSILVRYGLTNKKKATSLFGFFTASYTQNSVSSSTFIASKDTLLANDVLLNKGSQITSPVNLSGAVSGSAFLNYGFPIEKILCNMNLTGGLSYNRSPGLLNDLTNWSGTYNINGGFVLGSNISEKIDFTIQYSGSYNFVNNTLQQTSNNNYFNHTATVKFNWLFYKGFVFNSQLQNTLYEGISQGFNVDVYIWNVALGYKFLKDKSLEVRVGVNDLLNQNTGISRTVTGTYVEDDRTQVIKRYLLVTATYTLKYYKKG